MAMTGVTDADVRAQIPAPRKRARRHPGALKVQYDRVHRRLLVTLTNQTTLVVPIELIRSLRRAADRDLADVTVGVAGVGLRWNRLDEDLSISGLVQVALGRHALLRASAAVGGASRSAVKVAASRRNGRKGGRPPKALRGTAA